MEIKTIGVIPDIHQDFGFAHRCLSALGGCDHYVFLGDYFDTPKRKPEVYGFSQSCEELKSLVQRLGSSATFLVGNHDMAYIYSNHKSSNVRADLPVMYNCSGVTKSKVSKFRRRFFDEGYKDDYFLNNFKIAHMIDGWIFSHAGIIAHHIPYGMGAENLVNEVIPDVFRNFRDPTHIRNYLLSDIGVSRGGGKAMGGVLWCDWRDDFYTDENALPYRQMLGHSTVNKPVCINPGTITESWNIDAKQKFCAKIENNNVCIIGL